MNWIGWLFFGLLSLFLLCLVYIFVWGIYSSFHPEELEFLSQGETRYKRTQKWLEPVTQRLGKFVLIIAGIVVVIALSQAVFFIIFIVQKLNRALR